MRNAPLIRVLSLLRDLEAGGTCALSEIAARYGVHSRTVRRDFAALQDAGYPICRAPESGPGDAGRWWLKGKRADGDL